MNRRKFLAAVAAIPFLGRLVPAKLVIEPLPDGPIQKMIRETLADLGTMKYADITADLQIYVAANRLLER